MKSYEQWLEEIIEKELSEIGKRKKYCTTFHLMPPIGWLNDPNGLCQFKGEYHVFFQYSPLDVNGGKKFWGHYVSKDMVRWEYKGIALAPDNSMDKDGVYSGSALVEQNNMYLFYTGNVKREGAFDYIDTGREAYQIMVTSDDGLHMSEKKCLLSPNDYPKDYTTHIRDPKVFKKNEMFYMLLGGRKKVITDSGREDRGAVLIYSSSDLKEWSYCNELKSKEHFGYMWECPDTFELEDKTFLSFSPQGLIREEFQFQNVYQSGYARLYGDMEGECSIGEFREWDMGFDFYAPQTFETDDGRRILIGWAGMPDSEKEYQNKTVEEGWQHCLTVPREILFSDGILLQRPIKELEQLRKEERKLVSNEEFITNQKAWELEVTGIENGISDIYIHGESDEDGGIQITSKENTIGISFSGKCGGGRTRRLAKLKKKIKNMRLLFDNSIIELYVNDGEKVFTSRIYFEGENRHIKVISENSKSIFWTMD